MGRGMTTLRVAGLPDASVSGGTSVQHGIGRRSPFRSAGCGSAKSPRRALAGAPQTDYPTRHSSSARHPLASCEAFFEIGITRSGNRSREREAVDGRRHRARTAPDATGPLYCVCCLTCSIQVGWPATPFRKRIAVSAIAGTRNIS